MKYIHLVTPFDFRWIEYISRQFKDCRFVASNIPDEKENPDVLIFAWANQYTADYINNTEKKSKYIVCIRAYDFYEGAELINWSKVDKIYCVNDYISKSAEQEFSVKSQIIYNGTDLNEWKFKERAKGKKIAMVSFIHYKKNHPLALQILSQLPEDYEIHCAGDIQTMDVVHYLGYLAERLNRIIYIYGHIENMDEWFEDKDYILNTSMREGCPNSVIEAMAKGIKPVIHNWPGAREQFGKYVFDTVEEARDMILSDDYNSIEYRDLVDKKFSVKNYIPLRELVDSLED